MKVRCPCCGASYSLNALIEHDDAREALVYVGKAAGYVGYATAIRYLALFRPAERDLTFSRVAKILKEVCDGIGEGTIHRNGKACPAPVAAWVYAMQQAVDASFAGTLRTPLKGHGYILEIIANWRGDLATGNAVSLVPSRRQENGAPAKPKSKTAAAVSALQERINGLPSVD